MAYADFTKVSTLLDGEVKKRPPKYLFTTCSAKADAVVDSALGGQYTTPFTAPTPPLVEHIAQDLTIYYLLRSNYYAGVAGNDEETRRQYWEDAMDLIKGILKGMFTLPGVDPADADKRLGQISSTREDFHPSIDMGPADQWGPDKDLLEDLANEKD